MDGGLKVVFEIIVVVVIFFQIIRGVGVGATTEVTAPIRTPSSQRGQG